MISPSTAPPIPCPPRSITVTTGSAARAYDGTALTNADASISGLAKKDEGVVTVTANGSIKDAGSTDNTYSISWGGVSSGNYTLTESLGTLTVTALDVNCYLVHNTVEDSYELTVTCDNPNFTVTEVEPASDETYLWKITFSWGDSLTYMIKSGFFAHGAYANYTWNLTQSSTP